MSASSSDPKPALPQSLPPPPALTSPATTALFLDFDGTLVDIAPHPDSIVLAPGLPRLFALLGERFGGRLAIVSGRALADLDRHLGSLDITMAGSHGGELRQRGSTRIETFAQAIPRGVVDELRAFAAVHHGLLVEAKPFGVAIHYRDCPEAESQVIVHAGAIAAAANLRVKHGKMVIELLTPGPDKGRAVARLMARAPFTGALPLFVGDDLTDEDAFAEVGLFGGGGVLVGRERETAALWRLPGVGDVHHWLEGALV